jgi:peptidoglycan/xylan/chitin deacetylase (PgdA/CDA1 family)
MSLARIWERAVGKGQRFLSHSFFKYPVEMRNRVPLISFTFDDFPKSALHTGGELLKTHGARGTYYSSFGLMDTDAPVGRIFSRDDLDSLVADGHELGCHTYSHCHAWKTAPKEFEVSVLENRKYLQKFFPEQSFRTLSYPISSPRPHTKRRVAKHFSCCRGGGQTFNTGKVHRTHLNAFFIEQSRENPAAMKRVIDENVKAGGWLIFATHDVCDRPTRFGCTPSLFEEIVRHASESGAQIHTVGQAWKIVTATG